jgi:hypothetical protein
MFFLAARVSFLLDPDQLAAVPLTRRAPAGHTGAQPWHDEQTEARF